MYKQIRIPIIICFILVFCFKMVSAMPGVGNPAPLFALKDTKGITFEIEKMKTHQMVILYFFDAASPSSLEGLITLDTLAKKYKDADLRVWGITFSGESISELVKANYFAFII